MYAADGGPGPVRRRESRSATSSCCPPRCASSELQLRPVQHAGPGEPVLPLRRHHAAGDGPGLPGPGRDPRRSPARAGHPRQLRRNRRYAILACAAIAAFLPGDAITMLLETVPLYLLFEVSVLLASIADRRSRRVAAQAAASASA